MGFDEEVSDFIRATFRSIWSLELLLHLSENAQRSWSRAELVDALRASDLIVSQSLESLIAAGLVSIDAEGCARYVPASPDFERFVVATKALYARSPNAVRRLIISSTASGVAAFADAFRLRKD